MTQRFFVKYKCFSLYYFLWGGLFFIWIFFFGGGLFGMFYVLCCQYYIKNTPEWSDIHDLRDNYPLIVINHLTCPLFKLAVSIFNMFGLIDGLVLTCKSLFVHGFCWTCRKSVKQTFLKRSVYILIFASSPSVSNGTIYLKYPNTLYL